MNKIATLVFLMGLLLITHPSSVLSQIPDSCLYVYPHNLSQQKYNPDSTAVDTCKCKRLPIFCDSNRYAIRGINISIDTSILTYNHSFGTELNIATDFKPGHDSLKNILNDIKARFSDYRLKRTIGRRDRITKQKDSLWQYNIWVYEFEFDKYINLDSIFTVLKSMPDVQDFAWGNSVVDTILLASIHNDKSDKFINAPRREIIISPYIIRLGKYTTKSVHSVKIIDILGNVLISKKVTDNNEGIDINNLTVGSYFLQIDNNTVLYFLKSE